MGPPEVPKEILDAWDNDSDIQDFLSMFASEDLAGKKLLSYRDVAKLMECMGLSREELTAMINGEMPEEDDFDYGSGKGDPMHIAGYGSAKGNSKGMQGKGGFGDFDNDMG